MTGDVGVGFKKIAVLTGLTILVGGAEISQAKAAPINQTDIFSLDSFDQCGCASDNETFSQFNSSLGTLTGVTVGLTSSLTEAEGFTAASLTAPDAVSFSTSSAGTFDQSTMLSTDLSPYIGSGTITADLDISGPVVWAGSVEVNYTYTPAPPPPPPLPGTPLPGALPLFATGLASLGVGAWRKRRKQQGR
jgi:hypothetical protein